MWNKGHPKAGPKHAGSIRLLKARAKKKRGNKKLNHPHLESNQSKKLTKSKGPLSINNLV